MFIKDLLQAAIDYNKEAARGWRIVENGYQWPKSLQDFARPIRIRHEFYEWVLNLGM